MSGFVQRPDDVAFMRAAVAIGARGLGRTWPNPSVGCVIVQGRRIVGRGHTAAGGRPHAETQALAQAAEKAKGASVYVTLEPCSHTGKTPPCAEALVKAGITRCVVAMTDPDQRVSGRGLQMMNASGIETVMGVGEDAARAQLSGYLTRTHLGRPEMVLKLASTVDGKIATSTGESRWITGAEARANVHMERAKADAVMVGIGTVLADDPMLDVRGFGDIGQPVRIIVDTHLRIPLEAKLVKSMRTQPLWIIHGPGTDATKRATLEENGARMIEIDVADDGQLDLTLALKALGTAGLTRVYCEGGAGLAAGLLAKDLVDRATVYFAGTIIGKEGVASVGELALERLDAATRLELQDVRAIGGDVFTTWSRKYLPWESGPSL